MTKLLYDVTRCTGLGHDGYRLEPCPIRNGCLRFTDRPDVDHPISCMPAPTLTGDCADYRPYEFTMTQPDEH